ncbi:Hypothetical_protein [Hexamita inflata]|uniref:Hypothetical_protein n=1 Tax=Hexamita inflata TaxID=28002 RepID=A0ABP1H4D8_9EUKA
MINWVQQCTSIPEIFERCKKPERTRLQKNQRVERSSQLSIVLQTSLKESSEIDIKKRLQRQPQHGSRKKVVQWSEKHVRSMQRNPVPTALPPQRTVMLNSNALTTTGKSLITFTNKE